jgi:putative transposase
VREARWLLPVDNPSDPRRGSRDDRGSTTGHDVRSSRKEGAHHGRAADVWASGDAYYRLLRQAGESRERRRQASHPASVKPELLATAPNQVWSWDITKLHGPAKWTYYHLYVILDIFSWYVVGWMVAHRESAALAQMLIHQTRTKQSIGRDQLTIHADRGSSMISEPVAFLLADLGITQSHSRPHVCDDNPLSEAQFKP